jgi:tetratricopeptide (TPR) repeat protein
VSSPSWPWRPAQAPATFSLLEKRLTSAFESGDREDFAETLRRAALGFPAEPSFALLAGAEGVRYRTPGTGRWLSRAMTLAPGWGGPHAEAALALLNVGNRNQAILELGAAAARDLPGARKVTCLFVPRVGAAIANAAPSDPVQRLRFLDQAASCPGATPEFAEKMDADILAAGKLSPETRYARLRIARRALAARDADKAIGALERMSLSNPKDADLGALYAHALLSAGRHSDALRALDRLRKASPTTDEPLRVEAHVRAKLGDIEGSKKVIEKLRGRAHARGEALASVSLLEADIEEGLGHMHRALTALEDAMRYRATPHTLARIARVAESAGLTGRARTAHRSLCEGRMDGVRRAEHCQALDRLEKNGP